jgi:hypothetical protein
MTGRKSSPPYVAGSPTRMRGKRRGTAVAYVQFVYGRQLQQSVDETPPAVEALDVSRMTIAERESLKRRILARHPRLAQEILGEDA